MAVGEAGRCGQLVRETQPNTRMEGLEYHTEAARAIVHVRQVPVKHVPVTPLTSKCVILVHQRLNHSILDDMA